MSDAASMPPDEDRERLAAEYALGVLDERERRHVEAVSARDDAFAGLLLAWETRLSPLAEEIAPVAPPESVWSRIETVVAPSPIRPSPQRSSGLAFWRWLSFGSMAVAAASIAAAVVLVQPAAPLPIQIAALVAADGKPAFTAVIDRTNGQTTLVPQGAWQASGRVPELWLVPANGAPVSLGVFDPAQIARAAPKAPALAGVSAGVTLAVSVEPPGGSPTGQPTGAVIATGKVQSL